LGTKPAVRKTIPCEKKTTHQGNRTLQPSHNEIQNLCTEKRERKVHLTFGGKPPANLKGNETLKKAAAGKERARGQKTFESVTANLPSVAGALAHREKTLPGEKRQEGTRGKTQKKRVSRRSVKQLADSTTDFLAEERTFSNEAESSRKKEKRRKAS